MLDELFAERPESDYGERSFGEFTFDGDLAVGKIADFYDLPVPEEQRAMPLGGFVAARLRRQPEVGDRVRMADIDLVVRAVREERITEVGIDLEPRMPPRPSWTRARGWMQRHLRRLRGASTR